MVITMFGLTCWLDVGILAAVEPALLPLLLALFMNIDFMPFLSALSSPSMMSPIKILTKAYSISEKNTKTVQPDMKTSIACSISQTNKRQISPPLRFFFSDGLAFCSHRAAADWSLRTSQANPNCRIDFVGPSGSSLLCRSFINCQNQWDARALTREFSPCFFTLISSTRSDPWIYLFFLFSVWTFNFFPTLFPSFPDIDRKNKRTRETKQSFREAFYLESWWSVASDLVPFFSRRMAFPWPIFLGQLGECALCILTDECLCL